MRVSRVKDTLVQIKFKEAGSRYRALSVSTLAERDAEMPADIPAGMTDDETDSAATSATDDPDAEMASLLDGLVAGNALLDEQLFPGLGNGGEDDGEEDHGAGRSDAPFYAGWLLKAPGSQQLGPKKRRVGASSRSGSGLLGWVHCRLTLERLSTALEEALVCAAQLASCSSVLQKPQSCKEG